MDNAQRLAPAVGLGVRVVQPGGGLALVWNAGDDSEPVVRKLAELVDRHSGGAPQYHTGQWRTAFARPNGFTPLARATFPFRREVTVEQVVDRIRSTSFVAGLPEHERASLLEEVGSLMREHMAGPGAGRLVLPSATEVYTCSKS